MTDYANEACGTTQKGTAKKQSPPSAARVRGMQHPRARTRLSGGSIDRLAGCAIASHVAPDRAHSFRWAASRLRDRGWLTDRDDSPWFSRSFQSAAQRTRAGERSDHANARQPDHGLAVLNRRQVLGYDGETVTAVAELA